MGDAYTDLARKTLESYVTTGHMPDVDRTALPNEMTKDRAGAFVSLKKHGQLRGCIGTIGPVQPCLADEIMNNAVSAGTGDPRFRPVPQDELADLVYSVDVLGEPEQIYSLDDLDVHRYGVIVSNGRRRGLLLPDLEGVDTPEEQVGIAMQKGGIAPEEPIMLERFEVVRHK